MIENDYFMRALMASVLACCALDISSNRLIVSAIFSDACMYLPTHLSVQVISPICKSGSLNFPTHFEKQVFVILRIRTNNIKGHEIMPSDKANRSHDQTRRQDQAIRPGQN